ncbi:hypothetical protein [Eleftheria terrae]|uniref:hypothetical protein n=1 Tax=Eleftheria terrae TaxID=1597781 RepID=UPI00263AFBB3|nr:hypothetical protein [Eleftheria terrae]WKB55900.1 hypothetical protein N7L95_27885 [Eleftheria terrae]
MAIASTDALRVHRRGQWLCWSREGLRADVAALAEGWRRAGVRDGDTITTVGPLSAAFVLTLKAAPLIGACVQPLQWRADADALPDVPLQHVLVDSTHELEALLARRPTGLGQVHVAYPLRSTAADGAVAVRVLPFAGLLRGPDANAGPTRDEPADPLEQHADRQRGLRVLAEFEPHWAPGLAWLQQEWWRQAATLVLPEPGGDAWADRRRARPDLWVAPAGTLEAAARDIARQTEGRPGGWLRWRAAAVLGLRPGLRWITDGPLSRPTVELLESFGAAPLSSAGGATAWPPHLAGAST